MASSDARSLISITIVQAVNLSFPANSRRQLSTVEIITGDVRRRTESIKSKKDKITRWDSKLLFPFLDNSSKLIITILHDRLLWSPADKYLGRIDIELGDLLERQDSQPNEDVVLSFVNRKGDQSAAKLTVRITRDSTSAVAGNALEQAQTSTQNLSQPLISDALTNTSDTLSNQQDLMTSFNSLMKKVEPLVKIGDEVAKIHPYVNFAWKVLSAGMKMAQAQQVRNVKILNLVREMEDTYSFVLSADELKSQPVLQDIIAEILKQTIECGYFIQDYARRSFGESAIVNSFTDVDDQIAAFCASFSNLRNSINSRVSLTTALFLPRMASSVDMITRHQLLKPEAMDEYNRTPCLNNTRCNVINDVMEWIADDSNAGKKVLWVYGLAGTGKSTLSTTIAQIMRGLHRLGAFIFFNRDIPQRNFATLIRTLAYQLAMLDARFGDAISRVVANNANIAGMPLAFQFEKLLSANALKAVEWSGGPIVLIIDALDECGSEADRKILMQVLSKGFSDLPSFIRIMIVSRQEQDIQRALESHSHVRQYPLDIDSVTIKDVTEFIRYRLEEIRIKDGYLGDHWPGDAEVSSLADHAGGLFIWASTACLYIESHVPNRRLSELVIKQPGDNSSRSFAQLDSLYKTGLQSLSDLWNDGSLCSDCCNILGAILCARVPLSCSVIDTLLALPQDMPSWKSLSRLRCVLQGSKTEPIRILHPSFYDYLSDPARCGDQPWSINVEHHNKELALRCIELLDKELRENICDMTLPYLSRKNTLPEAISYACKFWIEHICLVSDVTDDIVNQMDGFLVKHLLHWMEALAILNSHDHTIRSIDNLTKWLRKSSRSDTELQQLLYDGQRFAQHFANTIKEHPLLIYAAALPFTPTNTSIFKKFYHNGLPKVVCGVGQTWSPELIQLQGHDAEVSSIALSPDGSKIISGSEDKTIRVWDAGTGVEILPALRGHDDAIFSVAISPDGSKIISGSEDMTIRVWDASTGIEMLPLLRGHDESITSVAFSPDGSKIISGSFEMTIRVWDASTGAETLPPFRGHDGLILSVAFSPDGSKIISGSYDRTIRVWDASTGIEMLPPLRGHEGWVLSVTFSPDGSKIISGSEDMTVRVWDASTGIEILPPLRGHDLPVLSVAFSPDGSKIISGSDDNTIRVWDASTGIEIFPPLRGHSGSIVSVRFSPDGSKIVSGSEDMTIRVWDASTGAGMLPPHRGHDYWIQSVAFSPDGSKIVSGSEDKTVRVWDASTGAEIHPPLQGHDDSIISVAFSPDGSKIISGSDDMTIRVWDASTGVEMRPPLRGHDSLIHSVAFSPDGSKIISGSFDKTIRVWDASTGEQMLPPFRGHDNWIRAVVFSPDGSKIISGSEDKTIRVWDASTGIEMLPPLRGHGGPISSVAFSPDGSKIISGSGDKTIRVWDASTGAEVLPPLRGHDDCRWIKYVAFSPDGSKIISESVDGIIRVWDAGAGVMLPRPQVAADDTPRPAMMIRGWLTNINTGRYMGALPVDARFHSGRLRGSTYLGWTAEFKLVIIHLPEQ
ncbi:hypothetical protein AX14_013105 [Amanita brunnescens Koide BX004]|nr:hypothetical protein AX14_013105 [Amanita brunnescens Koide BX004]